MPCLVVGSLSAVMVVDAGAVFCFGSFLSCLDRSGHPLDGRTGWLLGGGSWMRDATRLPWGVVRGRVGGHVLRFRLLLDGVGGACSFGEGRSMAWATAGMVCTCMYRRLKGYVYMCMFCLYVMGRTHKTGPGTGGLRFVLYVWTLTQLTYSHTMCQGLSGHRISVSRSASLGSTWI